MKFNIVHIISGFEKINFGIWNAAVFGSSFLKERYAVTSSAIACTPPSKGLMPENISIHWAGNRPSADQVKMYLDEKRNSTSNTIIVTHGCWLSPTRLGYQLRKKGFYWLCVPHGMLEPWSRTQARMKKDIYYFLFERRYIKMADSIRAVSKTEAQNLRIAFSRDIATIENGVHIPTSFNKKEGLITYLFMARLHFKKGILHLVKAWSKVMEGSGAQLVIAGPDEGELEKIEPYFNDHIIYVGAVYGEEKTKLLNKSHYYMLPSYSEGFPTSVLEAMSYGIIPLISSGCNFPEVFENNLGYQIEPTEDSIVKQLSLLKEKNFDYALSMRNQSFIADNYSESAIGEQLYSLYQHLFQSGKK